MSEVAVADQVKQSVVIKGKVVTFVPGKDLVQIKEGSYNRKMVNGYYPLLNIREHSRRGLLIQVRMEGQVPWINVESGEFHIVKEGEAIVYEQDNGRTATLQDTQTGMRKLTEAQAVAVIKERFEVMNSVVECMIDTDIRSVIIFGAAGIGKTFNVLRILEEREQHHGQHWMEVGGKCTPVGLYKALWACRNEGSILVLDDVDVWSEEDSLNCLKKALDTTKRRIIDWRSAGKSLEEDGIPDSFEFKGKVIFLTNVNAYAEIARGTKRSPHLNALISRSVALDLGIHDVRTIFLHVRTVVRDSDMLMDLGLDSFEQEEILDWMAHNLNELAAVSLRTPRMIAQYMMNRPETWQTMCKHTLLKATPLIW